MMYRGDNERERESDEMGEEGVTMSYVLGCSRYEKY